ncbi:MAG TPA: hypothetical protein VK044_07900 [Virgibacillus sp.]|nr:hypothetical protein [Virgibacillus sp.]
MDIPAFIIWFAILIMFLYAFGFSITLWREQNKAGATAIFILAVAIIITPFFQILR